MATSAGPPYVFAATETKGVRGCSIGPRHLDWVCFKCGAVSPSPPSTGMFSWRWQRRKLVEHLQRHVPFEEIEHG